MKPVWALGMAIVGLFMGLGWYLQPLQPSIVALQFTFSPGAFQAVLDAWGPQGVQRFRTHLGFDGALLLCYGAFGYLLVRYSCLFKRVDTITRQISGWAMPGAAVLDAIENLLHLVLISEPATHAPALYLFAGVFATGKWLLIANFMAGTAYLLVAKWRHGCEK